jgi:hypothetical protein
VLKRDLLHFVSNKIQCLNRVVEVLLVHIVDLVWLFHLCHKLIQINWLSLWLLLEGLIECFVFFTKINEAWLLNRRLKHLQLGLLLRCLICRHRIFFNHTCSINLHRTTQRTIHHRIMLVTCHQVIIIEWIIANYRLADRTSAAQKCYRLEGRLFGE